MPRWNAISHPDYPYGAINLKTGRYFQRVILNPSGEVRIAFRPGAGYLTLTPDAPVVPAPALVDPVEHPDEYAGVLAYLRRQHFAGQSR